MSRKDELAAAFPEECAELVAAERSRIRAILSSDEAKGRTELANHLAFETCESPASARAILALTRSANQFQYDDVITLTTEQRERCFAGYGQA